MKQHHLGIFKLNWQNIDVYTFAGVGGEFYFSPDKTSLPRMKIGLDYDSWHECVGVAFHEAQEYVMAQFNVAFKNTGYITGDTANRLFVFDHSQFGEIVGHTAYFMTILLPELAKEYKLFKKKKWRGK